MLQHLGARLTYANVMSTIAVFVALGGSSYAAVKVGTREIANNSVRSIDIRKNEVSGSDIRKGQVRGSDLRNNDVSGGDLRNGSVAGADVKDGSLASVDLAPNAIDGRSIANLTAGDFAPGQLPDPVPATLPSGKTLRGVYAAAVTGGPGDSGIGRTAISFSFPLAAAPGSSYLPNGGSNASCPGSAQDPSATAGNLCVYEAGTSGPVALTGIFDPLTGVNFRASRFGAVAFVNGDAGATVRGSWAVTAP